MVFYTFDKLKHLLENDNPLEDEPVIASRWLDVQLTNNILYRIITTITEDWLCNYQKNPKITSCINNLQNGLITNFNQTKKIP